MPDSGFDLFQTMCDINCFVRSLTLKSNFLAMEDTVTVPNISAHLINTDISNMNEFDGLMFSEQKSLLILQEMATAGDSGDPNTYMREEFKTPNPQFYPIKSRAPILDIFQMRMEKDLVPLEGQTNKNK